MMPGQRKTQTQYFEDVRQSRYLPQGAGQRSHVTAFPWMMGTELTAIEDDVWELYGPDDWTQAHNIAKTSPRCLKIFNDSF